MSEQVKNEDQELRIQWEKREARSIWSGEGPVDAEAKALVIQNLGRQGNSTSGKVYNVHLHQKC